VAQLSAASVYIGFYMYVIAPTGVHSAHAITSQLTLTVPVHKLTHCMSSE